MRSLISPLSLALANLAAAQISGNYTRDAEVFHEFQAACIPRDSNNNILTDSPCFAMMGIVNECGWGGNGYVYYENSLPMSGHAFARIPVQDQRACFCQSRYFEQLQACQACVEVNDIPINDTIVVVEAGLPLPSPSVVSSFTASYCAITNTPTADFGDVVYPAFGWKPRVTNRVYQLDQTMDTSGLPTATSYITNEASYGYTPVTTAPTAYPVIPQTDHTAIGNTAWVTEIASAVPTLATSNGQIVPAAESVQKAYVSSLVASASSAAAARPTTVKGAADKNASARLPAVAGVIAFIGAIIVC